MLEAGAHFGHKTKYWNPKMSPYIYGERNGIHIINLETTIPMLSEACDFVQTIASQSGTILFVGTKISVKNEIKDAGVECKMPYVSNRWLGGTLTNNQTISKSIKKLEVIEESLKEENTNNLSKKEILTLSRSYQKLDKGLGGIRDMKKIPDAIFIIDVNYEKNAVKEAIVLGIPIIAIVDTNSSPDGINYVIPSNDDSRATAKLITSVIKDSFLAGKKTIPILDNIDDEFVEVDDEGKIDASKVKRKRKIIINKKELVKETPVEETPVEETPVEETPVEETPVEETPVEENLVEETPVEEGNKK
jgi:small subunit ribosomal protein S2